MSLSPKYILTFTLLVVSFFGYNFWLIQRDDKMFDAYYRNQALENLKNPPSNQIQ
jgi:hypothetical protein